MALIRTQRLTVGYFSRSAEEAGTDVPVWTCPAGVMGVVRCIDAAASFITAQLEDPIRGCAYALISPGGGTPIIFGKMNWAGQLPGTEGFAVGHGQYEGTCVFYPGDILLLGCDRPATVSYQVSGAILDL